MPRVKAARTASKRAATYWDICERSKATCCPKSARQLLTPCAVKRIGQLVATQVSRLGVTAGLMSTGIAGLVSAGACFAPIPDEAPAVVDGNAPALVWHEGRAHRVVVAFAADAQVRLNAQGTRVQGAPEARALVDAVNGVLEAYGVPLAPVFADMEAQLTALEGHSAGDADLRGMFAGPREEVEAMAAPFAAALRAIPGIAAVYFEPLEIPPPGDIAPVTESFVARQTYRFERGISLTPGAVASGADGTGIRLADIEYGWDAAHEDLVDRTLTLEANQTIPPFVVGNGWDNHGTAVLGITSAVDNAYGITGMVPNAEVLVFPENSVEGGARRAAAIASAAAQLRAGDVMLLEMQTPGALGGYGPAEYDLAVWQAVKAATDAGIVVVAAAGNGSEDLDHARYAEYRGRGDSGAILVGAADEDHRRLDFSSHGTRVDLHGFGKRITTLGYGDLAMPGNDHHQAYTADFGGTSSASPMVASAAVAVQSYAKAKLGRPLAPRELRDLLVGTGTAQVRVANEEIGPMPNVAAAIAMLATPPPPPPPPPMARVIINEVLADPPAGYDASGDGVASTTGDEFVEFINVGSAPIDLSGATLSDEVGVRVTLPAGTIIKPGLALVVFGGGRTGTPPPNATYISLGSLALNNTRDSVTLRLGNVVLATHAWRSEGGKDQSLVRAGDADPNAPMVGHRSVTTPPMPASPGTRQNGRPFFAP